MAAFSLLELFRKTGTSPQDGGNDVHSQRLSLSSTSSTTTQAIEFKENTNGHTAFSALEEEKEPSPVPPAWRLARPAPENVTPPPTLVAREEVSSPRLTLKPEQDAGFSMSPARPRTKLPTPRVKAPHATSPSSPPPVTAQPAPAFSPSLWNNNVPEIPPTAVPISEPAAPPVAGQESPFQIARETVPAIPVETRAGNASRQFVSPFEIVSHQNTPAVIASPFAFNEIEAESTEDAAAKPLETVELKVRELLQHAPAGDLYFNPEDIAPDAKTRLPAAPLVAQLLTGKGATVTIEAVAKGTDATTAGFLRRCRPGLPLSVPLRMLLHNLPEASETTPAAPIETIFQTPFSVKAEEDSQLAVAAFPFHEPAAEATLPAASSLEATPVTEEAELNPLAQIPFLEIPEEPKTAQNISSPFTSERVPLTEAPERLSISQDIPRSPEAGAPSPPERSASPTSEEASGPLFVSPFETDFGLPMRPLDEEPIPLESLREHEPESPLPAVASTEELPAPTPMALFSENAASPPVSTSVTSRVTRSPIFSFAAAPKPPPIDALSAAAPIWAASPASSTNPDSSSAPVEPEAPMSKQEAERTETSAPSVPVASPQASPASPFSFQSLAMTGAPAHVPLETPVEAHGAPSDLPSASLAEEKPLPAATENTAEVAPAPASADSPAPTPPHLSPFATAALPPVVSENRSYLAAEIRNGMPAEPIPLASPAPETFFAPPHTSPPPSGDVEDLSFGYISDPAQLALRAIFSTDQTLRPEDVVDLTAQFPGLRACLILTTEAVVPATSPSQDESVRQFHARARGLFDKTIGLARELDPEAPDQTFTLRTAKGVISFFAAGDVCLAALHAEPNFQPGVREKLTLVAQSLKEMLRAA